MDLPIKTAKMYIEKKSIILLLSKFDKYLIFSSFFLKVLLIKKLKTIKKSRHQ